MAAFSIVILTISLIFSSLISAYLAFFKIAVDLRNILKTEREFMVRRLSEDHDLLRVEIGKQFRNIRKPIYLLFLNMFVKFSTFLAIISILSKHGFSHTPLVVILLGAIFATAYLAALLLGNFRKERKILETLSVS